MRLTQAFDKYYLPSLNEIAPAIPNNPAAINSEKSLVKHDTISSVIDTIQPISFSFQNSLNYTRGQKPTVVGHIIYICKFFYHIK